jgi:hypothetical protein
MTDTPQGITALSRAMVGRIRSHIEIQRNQYKDHVGALFFLNLCEAGPEHVWSFFARYSAEGYNMELNELEVEALKKAGDATQLTNRLEDIAVARNVQSNMFNRRRLLLIGAGGLALTSMAFLPLLRDEVANRGHNTLEEAIDERAERIIAYAS